MEKAGAVIVAAGRGVRMGTAAGAVPKQYRPVAGIPAVRRVLSAFEQVGAIAEIVLVVPKEDVNWVSAEWLSRMRSGKPVRAVAGGRERQESVALGLAALSPDCAWVVVHDGARPLVTPELIERVLQGARETGAAVAGVPVSDTVKRVFPDGRVADTLPRESLRAIQTPQAFRRDVLERAHRAAALEGGPLSSGSSGPATDDAALVERLGHPVLVVPGDVRNIKLTYPEDFLYAEALVNRGRPVPFRIGYGFDVHRLEAGRPLILGGVRIPWELGLSGHSDADVLAHAITDGVLGAAGLGDIGRHFPDTDEAYRGADSLLLLERAVQLAAERGWHPAQADATVVAQRPKLAPYIPAMEERLAAALGVEAGQVNVKATTSEGLGFTGRGEGIAAYAVVLLCREGGWQA